MCMDEFVKILYDFMGIYKNFWSQNSDYRYLPIFIDILPIFTDIYRYFTDILPIFFQKFLHKRACSTVAIFRWKNRFFPIFWRKIGDFTYFSPIFPLIDFSSDFSSRCRPKTDFSTKYRSKKPIFCSLVPFIGIHIFTKIGQSLLCSGSSTQHTTCMTV